MIVREAASAECHSNHINITVIIQTFCHSHESKAPMGETGRRQSWGQLRNKNQDTWLEKWPKTSQLISSSAYFVYPLQQE